MKKLLSLILVLLLCCQPLAAFAEDAASSSAADAEPAAGETAEDADTAAAAERGKAAILAANCSNLLVLPKDESFLSEWKTGYARKAFKAPCLRVERISKLHTGRDVMPYLYEGTEATIVAEENDMSCILYRGSDNRQYVGWIQSIRLLDEFPGLQYTVGDAPGGELRYRNDLTVDWSRRSWLTTQQNYSVLSEELKDCLGFTLEYQIISENTSVWDNILGPRKIYVRSGGEWVEVGEFPYPDFGAVRVQVWLPQPMDIDAVGTIAQCRQPDIFWFRQTLKDIAFSAA